LRLDGVGECVEGGIDVAVVAPMGRGTAFTEKDTCIACGGFMRAPPAVDQLAKIAGVLFSIMKTMIEQCDCAITNQHQEIMISQNQHYPQPHVVLLPVNTEAGILYDRRSKCPLVIRDEAHLTATALNPHYFYLNKKTATSKQSSHTNSNNENCCYQLFHVECLLYYLYWIYRTGSFTDVTVGFLGESTKPLVNVPIAWEKLPVSIQEAFCTLFSSDKFLVVRCNLVDFDAIRKIPATTTTAAACFENIQWFFKVGEYHNNDNGCIGANTFLEYSTSPNMSAVTTIRISAFASDEQKIIVSKNQSECDLWITCYAHVNFPLSPFTSTTQRPIPIAMWKITIPGAASGKNFVYGIDTVPVTLGQRQYQYAPFPRWEFYLRFLHIENTCLLNINTIILRARTDFLFMLIQKRCII